MKKQRLRRAKPIYTPGLLNRLLTLANVTDTDIAVKFATAITLWAQQTWLWLDAEGRRREAREIEKELREIVSLAKTLGSKLGRITTHHVFTALDVNSTATMQKVIEERVQRIEQVQAMLDELVTGMSEAAQRMAREKIGPQLSKRRKAMRRDAVEVVGIFWKDLTGKRPARITDPVSKRPRGPFYEFAVTALRPIFGNEAVAIDTDIRHIARSMEKSPHLHASILFRK